MSEIKSVQVQLTTKCNERCFMCRKYTWESKEIDINTLIRKIVKYYDSTFTFSGGDPLNYSELHTLNQVLEQNDIVYQVFTNMNYILTYEQHMFLDNARCIQVSLDGSDHATYHSVRRCTEFGFNTVIENILSYANKIKANCTVSCRNYFDVRNIYNLCKNIKIPVRFFPVHTDENAMLQQYMVDYIINSFVENCEPVPEEVNNFLKIYNSKNLPKPSRCYVKSAHRIIDESGKEYPCCRAINDNGRDWKGKFSLGNLNDLDNPNVLYDFCKDCDRYVKFNAHWDDYKDKKELFL